ncbi:hypothetical protein RFI_33891 [Reticulomyxa filosa]|uniref:Uncharacterized protein n=1 Tax=Reticulomyxa filosa TaxID=46433 RepID=X6LPH4_RETFI|nr:hypothetical protein RFI_33891 [Reticulomyxa filosa]|eukprot:ETO03514.1 hypothetical protein RFI_33891 [Reticulomyxa filosa]
MLEMKDKLDALQFKTGDCYMIMDLGAGTADMVCHEIIGPFEVREMISSFGGPWGSSYIDDDIIEIFDNIFGKDKMKQFRENTPKLYWELLDNIEKSKQRFFLNKKAAGTHQIETPRGFDQFMKDNISDNLEELVSNFEYLGESGLVFISLYYYLPK